jgi:hypothetical protein
MDLFAMSRAPCLLCRFFQFSTSSSSSLSGHHRCTDTSRRTPAHLVLLKHRKSTVLHAGLQHDFAKPKAKYERLIQEVRLPTVYPPSPLMMSTSKQVAHVRAILRSRRQKGEEASTVHRPRRCNCRLVTCPEVNDLWRLRREYFQTDNIRRR